MEQFEPIAIIGQGCVLPSCFSPEDLWQTVLKSKVNITSPAEKDWRITMSDIVTKESDKNILGKTCTDKGGYIFDFESVFNTSNYFLDKDLINKLDPVFKWSFYAAYEALKNSGYADSKNSKVKEKTALILGNLSYPSRYFSRLFEEVYLNEFLSNKKKKETHPINRFMSGLPAVLTKQALNLGGEAFCLDAACASGLYAMKLACDKLQDRTYDMMLAGAVNAADQLFLHVGFTALKAISTNGESFPFNKNASGLIPAEGSAFVVLKRLSDAVKDGDNILGVIRSIALSNDGRAGGFLNPSFDGQVSCIKKTFECSSLSPQDISFIECHATGTKVGDNVEIRSMSKIFENCEDVTIGSLKANLGHLITASGIAGLIKVLKCMEYNTKVPTPNAYPVSSEVEKSKLRVLEKPEDWKPKNKKNSRLCKQFWFWW